MEDGDNENEFSVKPTQQKFNRPLKHLLTFHVYRKWRKGNGRLEGVLLKLKWNLTTPRER